MTSIAILEAVNTSAVQFHGQPIITAMVAGVAYVALKPIVENLGMSWGTQQQKLMKSMDKFNCIHMNMVASDKKLREVLCIPLRKLNGWLFSINPAKVRADIRDKLIQYQEECFTALHDYWTKGEVKNPRKKTTVNERTPLRDAVNMLVSKKHLMYPEAYAMVHQRFDVESIEDLEAAQITDAIEYVHRIALEGEFLGKQESLPAPSLSIDYPMEWFDKWRWALGDTQINKPWNYPAKRLNPNGDNPNPLGELLADLERAGFKIDAAKFQLSALQHHVDMFRQKIDRINQLTH
ncbi:phage antirepressor N-terminal domain-containing protein [Lonsdalea quercina]|uniref:phage antirepressor N-terminal domain-containing protein n=1 Tax=Lonsdalea quercina TaxID=71657 RepID=UPI0039754AE7